MTKKTIILGTRKSQLAMIQTNWVAKELMNLHKELHVEIVSMDTIGDKILDKALSKTGEKSLFTKELEVALTNKDVDIVVNSLKDMPSSLPPNLTISAVSKRENPTDAVVMHPKNKGKRLDDLPKGCVIGTSSLRRIAQLKKKFPDLIFKSIDSVISTIIVYLTGSPKSYFYRGNLNTRLRKLDDDDVYSAIILATAGLERMEWHDRISYELEPEDCLYAVGQGALAVETRSDDLDTIKLVSELQHKNTVLRCIAERAFLKTLEGGCSVPVAVHSYIINDELYLKGGVFSLDGQKSLIETMQTSLIADESWDAMIRNGNQGDNCEFASITINHNFMSPFLLKQAGHLGRDVAQLLLGKGAKEILDEAREENLKTLEI